MGKRHYKGREKLTHKMTRDGLVEVNAVTGEETRISQRGQDFNLQKGQEQRTSSSFTQQSHTAHGRRQTPSSAVTEQATYDVANGNSPTDYRQETQSPQTMQHGDMPYQNPNPTAEPTPQQQTAKHRQQHRATAEQNRLQDNGQYTVDNPQQSHQSSPAYSTPDYAPTTYTAQETKPNETPQDISPQAPNIPHTADIPHNPITTHSTPLSSYGALLSKRSTDEPIQSTISQPDQWRETDIPQAETPTPTSERRRLRFNDGQPQDTASAKPKQHGTKYQQGFASHVDTASSTDTPTIEAPRSGQAANIPQSQVSDTQRSTATTNPLSAEKLSADQSCLHFSDEVPQADTTAKPKQHGTRYQRGFTAQETTSKTPPTATVDAPTAKAPPKPDGEIPPKTGKQSRLHFSKNEQSPDGGSPVDKKLTRAQQNSDKVQSKLEKARKKLPHKKKVLLERTFDDEKGKAKRRLKFEKEVVPKGYKKPVSAPIGGAKAIPSKGTVMIAGKFHQKMYQVEHENVGVKSGHRVEQAGEVAYRGGKRVTRSVYRFIKERPYRTVAKLEKQAVKANIKLSYQKALQDNPKLKSNLLSRLVQKQKIKRQYAKAAKDAKKAAQAAKKTGGVIADTTKAVASFVSRHPAVAGTIALLFLLVIFIMTTFGSCSNMAAGILSSAVGTSYVAEDADIDNAELFYTEWETDLQLQVLNAEDEHPGYDEYRYNVGDIGHNPFELMAYLTAVHQDFRYSGVQADLQAIFNEQYTLSFTEEVEVRYRTETRTDTWTDEDGNTHSDSYTVEVPYNWYILNVNLESKPFTNAIMPRMNAEQLQMYNLYMITKGNRQYLSNPFDVNWLPYVSSYYGYRVHPVSGVKDYHKGIDIALPTGTEIKSGQDGRVTFADWSGDYGYLVVIEGEKGLMSKYAHCNTLLVSAGQEVKKGDPIATVGSTGNSTGPHLHLEIIKNGQYLNPIYFAITGDDGSSYIPPGSPGGVVIPPDPGGALGDGSYAALIAEAERYLGFPYVFGGSSPQTSFDCSGFVCWVYTRSGVRNLPRTTAQGIYNQCTPISPSNAQPGDLIFFHSTYSTPNTVTHVGIYVGGGMMLHCGDPISYASINSTYWQNHFYAFGRLN